jgi:hypothetical protein
MLKLQLSTRRLVMVACGVVLSATLAACGHHDDPQPAAQPSAVSQFISFVTSTVNKGAQDNTEPDAVDGTPAPTTDTDEPVTVS